MTLHLLPNLLGEHDVKFLPAILFDIVPSLSGIIAESARAGREFLSLFKIENYLSVPIAVIHKQINSKKDADFFLEPLVKDGESWGLLSDAGLPCVADPGALLVYRAREKGITIKGYPGPCSMMLALMMSGCPGQEFMFGGYLPKSEKEREKALLNYEKEAKKYGRSYIFIEAPYRNSYTFISCVKTLSPDTLFCVAVSLTTKDESVETKRIKDWQEIDYNEYANNIHKSATVFIIASSTYK